MISRLALRNWRSHENTELTFGKGTNVIMGPMGSGKSSAINGICFGLFGTFPDLQSRKLRLDDLIMNQPVRREEASVTVDFAVDGKTYSISRRIKRGRSAVSSSAELRADGTLVEGPQPSRVDEKVREILRLDYDLFSRAIYSEQNAIDYFLEIPKGQRKQKIDELLKISKFESARKTLVSVVARLRDRAAEARKGAASSAGFAEIPLLNQQVTDGDLLMVSLDSRIKSLSSSVAVFRKEVGDFAAKRKVFREFVEKATLAEGAARTIEDRLLRTPKPAVSGPELDAKIAELEKERRELLAKQEEVQKLEREYERENLMSERAFAEIERLEKRMSFLPSESAELQRSKINELEREAENVAGKVFSERHALAQLAGELEALHRGKDKCPVCETKLSSDKITEIANAKEISRLSLEGNVKSAEQKLSVINSERKNSVAFLNSLLAAAGERGAITVSLASLRETAEKSARRQKEITIILSGIRLERSPAEVDAELKLLEKASEHYELAEELLNKKGQAQAAKRKAAELEYDETAETEAAEKLKEFEKQHALAVQEQGSLSVLLQEKKKRLYELGELRKRAELALEEAGALEENVASFELLQSALQGVQSALRQEFTEETNLALTEVWSHIYPYRDYAALKLGVDDGGDYVLQLRRREGSWINVEGVTSGGERSTACLALRIALSLVLTQNLSWLVLDEPTHNLDKQAIRELAKTLREHLPKLVDQVFIITHEEELEVAASGNLYRFEREKEKGEPTRVTVD